MRISVIGCGYLGAVHASAMAELGHEVVGIDVDPAKIAELTAGRPPFFEPGLAEILTSAGATGRLRFSTDIAEAAGRAVHFIAVGTPQSHDGAAADLRYVDAAVDGLLRTCARATSSSARAPCRSAPRPGSPRSSRRRAQPSPGTPSSCARDIAVKDTLEPDRLVYGVAEPTRARTCSTRSTPPRSAPAPRASSSTTRRPSS